LTISAEGEALRVLERFCKLSAPSTPDGAEQTDDDLPSIFGISTVSLGQSAAEALAASEVALGKSTAKMTTNNPATLGKVHIAVSKSAKTKCPRCWKHRSEGESLCGRCAGVTKA
jgi:hypothetical protein